MVGKKGETKPAKMCDQCELIGGVREPKGGRRKYEAAYRVTNTNTGLVINLCLLQQKRNGAGFAPIRRPGRRGPGHIEGRRE